MRKAFATLFGWLFAALGGWFIAGSRKGEQERRLSGLLADTQADRDLRAERAERLASRLAAAEEERDALALEVTRLAQESQALRKDAQTLAGELAELRGAAEVAEAAEAAEAAVQTARVAEPAVAPLPTRVPEAVPAAASVVDESAGDAVAQRLQTSQPRAPREPSGFLAVLARLVIGAAVGAVVAWQWLQPVDPSLLDLRLDSSASSAQLEEQREVAGSFDALVAGAEKEGVQKWLAKYAVPWFGEVDETLGQASAAVAEAEREAARTAVVRDVAALLAAGLAVVVLTLGGTSGGRGGRRVAGVAVTLGELAAGATLGAGLYLVYGEFGVVPAVAAGVALLTLPYALLVLGARGVRRAWAGWLLLVLVAGLAALALVTGDVLVPGVATLVLAVLVWLLPVGRRGASSTVPGIESGAVEQAAEPLVTS